MSERVYAWCIRCNSEAYADGPQARAIARGNVAHAKASCEPADIEDDAAEDVKP